MKNVPRPSREVLIVTEDPEFFERARVDLLESGVSAIGCLGPASSPCLMEVDERCSMAGHVKAAIVDVPPTGSFDGRSRSIKAGDYAQDLASAHPDLFVLLAGAPEGQVGASSSVAHARDRAEAVELIRTLWGLLTTSPQLVDAGRKGDAP